MALYLFVFEICKFGMSKLSELEKMFDAFLLAMSLVIKLFNV